MGLVAIGLIHFFDRDDALVESVVSIVLISNGVEFTLFISDKGSMSSSILFSVSTRTLIIVSRK